MASTKPKKPRKLKKAKAPVIDMIRWDTTDAEEIERRRVRGETEKFHLEVLEPAAPYFGCFRLTSQQNKSYEVEIRSLTTLINSCDCPDYAGSGLGVCKHIEHVLFRLKKAGVKRFKQAAAEGSSRTQIFLEMRDTPVIKIQWTENAAPELLKMLGAFFSNDGRLLGNAVATYRRLQAELLRLDPSLLQQLRVSRHIESFITRQQQLQQKELTKLTFLKDVELGKKNLDILKCSLYPYQQQGMVHLAFNQRALLADEMGLGKTIQAIAACELLRREQGIQRVLVVATASLKTEWEEQIAKFTDLPAQIIQGSRAERLQQYQRHSFFYLTNYEQVVSDRAEIQRLLAPDVVILDEAQRIKNWQTKTANAIKELQSPYAFVLTGTPLENRIDDVYSVVQFLDSHLFGPLFRFNRDFYTLDEKGKPSGYKNLDQLHRRLKPIMLRRLKEDVEGQLPQRLVKNYFIKMDPEQQARYDEYKNLVAQLMAKAKHRPLRKEELEKLQRFLSCMRMLCDSPFILDSKCRVAPKIEELRSIISELLVDPTAKIIIFSEWERMLQLVKALAEANQLEYAWHTGSVKQDKRRSDINRFKQDPNCRLFLSTDSGSVGLNLQAANVVINLDLPWNPAKLEQRIARAWRKHQTRSVQVINLVCEDSIEHRMLHLLAQKQSLAKGVLDGFDDLKEMKLPSGRAAFIERMENLMSTAQPASEAQPAAAKPATTMSSDQLRNWLFDQLGMRMDLLQRHRHPLTEETTLLAIVDKDALTIKIQLEDSLKNQLGLSASQLEVLDRETLLILHRLAKAGIISFNKPDEVLHASPGMEESKKQIQEKHRLEAQRLLQLAAHKHRLVSVLINSEFYAEVAAPLLIALQHIIHAFAYLTNHVEEMPEVILSTRFITDVLVQQHQLPEKSLLMWTCLNEKPAELASAQAKVLLADSEQLFQFVQQYV